MAISVNLDKALDKAYESKSVTEILDAWPSTLAGITAEDDAVLKKRFGIDTVRELGTHKYFAVADVLGALEAKLD